MNFPRGGVAGGNRYTGFTSQSMNNISREPGTSQSFKCPYCHHSYCDRTHVDNCDRRMVGCPFCFHKFTSRLINTHIHSCSENNTNPSRGNGTTPGQFSRGSPGSNRAFRNRNRGEQRECEETSQVFTPEQFDDKEDEDLVEVPRITPMITKQKKSGKKTSSNRKKTDPVPKTRQPIAAIDLEEAEGFSPDLQDETPVSDTIRTVNMFGPTSNRFEEEKRAGTSDTSQTQQANASAHRTPFDMFPGPFRSVGSPTQHQHQQVLGSHLPNMHHQHHHHQHSHPHPHQHQHGHHHAHQHQHFGGAHTQPGTNQMPHRVTGNTSTTISLPGTGTTISITCPVMSNITYTTSDGGFHREMRIFDSNGGHFTQTSIIGGGGTALREDPCPINPDQLHRHMEGIFQQAMSNVMQMIPLAMGGPALDMGMTRHRAGPGNDLFGMFMNGAMPVFTIDMEVGGAGTNNENRGLDHEEINSIPVSTYKATRRENTNTQTSDKSCSVCINDFKRGDTLRTLPCTHKFHKDCIDPWLTNNGSCPICRERCS